MRISDWSSDVCSSDLRRRPPKSYRRSRTALRVTRQQNAKDRAFGTTLTSVFDHTPMISHQLGDQRKPKAAAAGLTGHKGVKQIVGDISRRARPGIDHADFDRKRKPAAIGSPDATEIGRQTVR